MIVVVKYLKLTSIALIMTLSILIWMVNDKYQRQTSSAKIQFLFFNAVDFKIFIMETAIKLFNESTKTW